MYAKYCTRVAFLGEKELGFPFFDTKKVPGTTGAYSHWLSSTSNAPVEKEGIHCLTYSTRLQDFFCCETKYQLVPPGDHQTNPAE